MDSLGFCSTFTSVSELLAARCEPINQPASPEGRFTAHFSSISRVSSGLMCKIEHSTTANLDLSLGASLSKKFFRTFIRYSAFIRCEELLNSTSRTSRSSRSRMFSFKTAIYKASEVTRWKIRFSVPVHSQVQQSFSVLYSQLATQHSDSLEQWYSPSAHDQPTRKRIK